MRAVRLLLLVLVCAGPFFSAAAPRAAASVPPTVELLVAPAPGESVYCAVPFAWKGQDVDGSVVEYRCAIDPPALGEPYWLPTTATRQTFFFQAVHAPSPLPPTGAVRFTSPHTFQVESKDQDGLYSDPASRAFFAYTIAPEVGITQPPPGALGWLTLDSTHVAVEWQGIDWDGLFSNHPVKYKWRLFRRGFGPEWDLAWSNPDSIRRAWAPAFAGWDSTSGDSAAVHFTNLVPGADYLFAVVGIDEAGAYSPRFALAGNLLRLNVREGLGVTTPAAISCLRAPRPSPATTATVVAGALSTGGRATLDVLDAAGRHVRTLVDGDTRAGNFEQVWNLADDTGRAVGPGVYLVRLRTDAGVFTRKLLVIR